MIPFKDNIPTDATPVVTLALIAANVALYVIATAHGGSLISGPDAQQLAKYGVIANELTWDKVFTSMFVHASILQLLGNMAFLWWFGNTIEDAVGGVRFFGIYVVGGVLAAGIQVVLDPDSTATIVGAGGAISALLGGYTVLYRGARLLTLVLIPLLFTVIEVPVLVMLVLWFAMQAAFAIAGLIDGAAYAGRGGRVRDRGADDQAACHPPQADPADEGRVMRQIVLVVSLLFITLIAVLTVLDIVHNGLNALDAVAILILGLFTTGIVGALRQPPPGD